MKILKSIAIGAFLLAGAALMAQQHQAGMIENTTAPMSEKVIRQRLRVMGYTDVKITKVNTLKYEINASKEGKPVVLNFHPQAGLVHEITPGKATIKPWTMPLEPPNRMPIRQEIPPK